MNKEKIKKKSIGENFAFQFVYQAVILIIPLIISPYLTRKLGDTSLGVFTYVNSLAYYFIVAANLGILRHGQRIIASCSDDLLLLRKTFWSLYLLHSFISVISIVCYILFILIFAKNNVSVYWIELIYVTSALFDITWFFYGIENFRSVVIKNAIIKLIETVLIIILVKKTDDLLVYTFITAGGIFLGQMILIPQAVRMVPPIKVTKKDVIAHMKPLLFLSITVVAVTLYTVFDKTLIGFLTKLENVAYYEYANKIISIPKTFITVIGTVMFPRACKMALEGKVSEQKRYLRISLLVVFFIGFGALFGLLEISKDFAIVYFGKDFAETGKIMMAFCPLPLIIGLGDIVRNQYLIPNHRDKEYIICILINASLNLILSISLIPIIGMYGAVVGTLAAELFGCIYQLFICRHYLSIKLIVIKSIPFLASGMVMYGCMLFFSHLVGGGIKGILIRVTIGLLIFSLLSLVYLLKFEKDLVQKIKKKIKRHS